MWAARNLKPRPKPKMRNKKPTNYEAVEQFHFFYWFDMQYPHYMPLCYAIPNGGKRDLITAVNLKRQGVRKGVLDINLDVPSMGYHGLRIEMKRQKVNGPSSVSKEQRNVINALISQNYKAVICYGFEEARITVIDYLGG